MWVNGNGIVHKANIIPLAVLLMVLTSSYFASSSSSSLSSASSHKRRKRDSEGDTEAAEEFEIKIIPCRKKCKETGNPRNEAAKNGQYVCGYPSEESSVAFVLSPCVVKCIEVKKKKMRWVKAENQVDCLCKRCKQEEFEKDGFCTEPGAPVLPEGDDCSLVCRGKAKYYGGYCTDDDDMKESKEA